MEQVTERTGNDPVEVGMSKGLTLGDVITIRKEEGLMQHTFRQVLREIILMYHMYLMPW